MLEQLQQRIYQRFDHLISRFVIDENEQVNVHLLEKLKKIKNTDTFIEALMMHLYFLATEEEKKVIAAEVTDEEKAEINWLVQNPNPKGTSHDLGRLTNSS